MTHSLDAATASRFASAALGHVAREYPNKMDHVLAGPGDVEGPRALHPIFFGSFDWHSCVHGWWTLFTLLRLHPDMPEAARIRALADELFTPENVAAETAYLQRPESRGFERPYGWAWLLMLAAELERHGDRRADALRPLTLALAGRFTEFLPLADYPVRVGTHYNTAFALRLTLDYAEAVGDAVLAALCRERAVRWHSGDRDCQAWEPSQDEFLSPALMEAVLMRRVMTGDAFAAWFDAFLPRLERREPATLFQPAGVSDRSDGKIAHLDGLNLSRAWCWREIASALDAGDPRRALATEAARMHLGAALPHVTGDYMGEHWLASFALLALLAGE
ncbi:MULTISPECIES: DUF2891 domain-containing protein [unclassified Brevundimonas]|uniref:DUF2891 domain-containing protein n=1 Tax=unclassified Brevundimonas TaxID=2622653 RepID=UPI0006FD318A|nr:MULTISPECIES: DUF2891 domain-containing protein [unclassified Brevundimonas]KQY66770.1 hypothetical protein ASD25_14635 [Brevundimonas sp. Root1423]KRA22826.1 hypothetical protein ASD59_09355 [Brevundimonas sp. Root608]